VFTLPQNYLGLFSKKVRDNLKKVRDKFTRIRRKLEAMCDKQLQRAGEMGKSASHLAATVTVSNSP
jgi:hypothetical protein